jgi:zinc protease
MRGVKEGCAEQANPLGVEESVMKIWFWLIIWLGVSVGVLSAQPVEPAERNYRIVQQRPDRLVVSLPNRMIVVAQELRSAPVVSAQVWVKTGSIYEQEHVGAGLSHFLEHLLSGGTTTTRTEAQTNALLGKIGARVNASTSLDNVNYYINTPAQYAGTAIDLLSDWMQNAVIPQAEYERERQVIQREFEHGLGSPSRVYWKLTQQARYRAHPARHPTIGYLDEFLSITRDEIYDFYKRMYVPNNMVFVVVGDIDAKAVVKQIADRWADRPEGELPRMAFPVEAEVTEPREQIGTATIDKPRLRLAWPGTRLGRGHDYALDLLAVALGQGESSRLVQTVRDQKQLVYNVGSYNLSFAWGEGFFGIDAEVAVKPIKTDGTIDGEAVGLSLNTAKAAILQQVARVRDEGITDAELQRAKRQTLAQIVYGAQTAEGMADRLARDTIGMGDPDYLQRYAAAITALTAAEVQAAARDILRDQRLLTVTLLPKPADQPTVDQVRPPEDPANKDLPQEPARLDNRALLALLEASVAQTPPSATVAQIDPIQRHVLSNGLRLLVQRSTVVPAVAIHTYRVGGLLAEPPGREGLSSAVSAMLMRGTASRSAQQIATQIEDLGADLSAQAGNNSSFVQAVCLREDWPRVLELVADVTLNPTFPEDEWKRMQPRLVAGIARQRDTWGGELGIHFRQAYFGGTHPWSVTPAGRAEAVSSFTVEDLRQYHREHLGAAETVLAVFGDVDPAAVVAAAEATFGKMPAQSAARFDPPLPPLATPGVRQVETRKPMAAVQIGFGPGITRRSPDYAALQVAGRVLSDFPSGWLEHALRGEGPGLVYAVSAFNMTGLVPGYFGVVFNTKADVATEALTRAMAVVERLKTQPVDEATLQRAKAAVISSEFFGKQSNSDRASDAALNELYDLGLDEPEQFLQEVQMLGADLLQVVARNYLTNPVTVVLTNQPLPQEALDAAVGGASVAPPTTAPGSPASPVTESTAP